MNVIYDANSLYRAYVRSKQNSAWKPQVQSYEMNFLTEIAKAQRELMNQTYKTLEPTHFIISERGKTRPITGEQMRDRVVHHSICDNVLTPTLRKYLIYDNGVSLEGKGMGFTRGRILTHLRKYYAANRTNKGYVLLIDFSKYYGRYMDDSYIIARDHETLEQLLLEIEAIADQLGVTINKKKTHIAKLETGFRFLQVRYTLTSTDRVMQRINPKRLTAMRRKLKKLAKKVSSGQLAQEDVANMYRSWLGAHRKLMSRQQVENINTLFNQLF